jgi:NAD(P)H-hydrate epimerase
MERAALACVEALHVHHFDLTKTAVVCGMGNNGGDGVAIARLLHLRGNEVELLSLGNSQKQSVQRRDQGKIAKAYCVPCLDYDSDILLHSDYTTIVDALFGIGLSGELTGIHAQAVRDMNATDAPVLSVDIPSGICANTGRVLGEAVWAKVTVTFAFCKWGLTLPGGKEHAGDIKVADIGIYALPFAL